jgi:hypothetical protein
MNTVKTLTEAYIEAPEKLLAADVERVSIDRNSQHNLTAEIQTVLV